MTDAGRATAKERERQRLAEALRENLKRRKAQQRPRPGDAQETRGPLDEQPDDRR